MVCNLRLTTGQGNLAGASMVVVEWDTSASPREGLKACLDSISRPATYPVNVSISLSVNGGGCSSAMIGSQQIHTAAACCLLNSRPPLACSSNEVSSVAKR